MRCNAGILVLVVTLSCGSITSRAQSAAGTASTRPMLLETAVSEALLDEAREAVWDFRMQEGERLLRRLQRQPDGRPAASFHLTSAALLRFLMSDDASEYETFRGRADSTRRLLAESPPSPWRDYLQAELDLQRAVALGKRNDFIRAAWAARSAYKGFHRIVVQVPDFYEPYKGIGILHLAIGSMPSSYRFLLRILGYSGSISRGLDELEIARTRSRYASDEAAAYLAVSYSMLYLSETRSLDLIGALHTRDPDSVVIAYLYGYLLISARSTDEATDVLLAARSRAAGPSHFYIDYLDFFLAEALFRSGRFREAVPYYLAYIRGHPGSAGKAIAHLHLGQALELTGQRQEAEVYYNDVTAAREFDTDEAARRTAEGLLAAPMSPRERTLLYAQCAYDSGRLEEAERLLKEVLADGSLTDEQQAEAGYRLGRVYDAMERSAAAINAYRVGIGHGAGSPGRWAPWGEFFIGKIHDREGRRDAAQAAYDRALSYGAGHDFHRALEQAVRAARS